MSRHIIEPLNPAHRVTVGYDRPLNHFFCEVDDSVSNRRVFETHMMRGVPTIEALRESLSPYANLSDEIVRELEREQREQSYDLCRRVVDHTAVQQIGCQSL